MATTTATAPRPLANSYTAGKLPGWAPWTMLIVSWAVIGAVFAMLAASGATKGFNIVGAIFFGTVLFDIAIYVTSLLIEGSRKAIDRLVTSLVATAFIIALLPLISLGWTVVTQGLARFDIAFFSESMRNVIGDGGGALHAIVGTLEITLMAAVISVPIGLLTSIYLVEYGRGMLARGITFFVDVMTGIPSIVAGLFAAAFFATLLGPGTKTGFVAAVAMSTNE